MYDKFFFIDFDGTITNQDSLDLLFEKFADEEWKKHDEKWEKGEIGSLENLSFVFSSLKISKIQLDFIITLLEVDDSFYDFLINLNKNNYGYMIISEGIDYIIENTLMRNAPENYNLKLLSNLEIRSNHFNGKEIIFSNNSDNCSYLHECKQCSNCKYKITKNLQAKEKFYIGDGLSDRFGILNCDFIFAKNKLSVYCKKNKISYLDFEKFKNINNLEKIFKCS